MDQVHEAAIERHHHYAKLARKLPSKTDRFRSTWPQERQEPEPVRDGHAALQARRGPRAAGTHGRGEQRHRPPRRTRGVTQDAIGVRIATPAGTMPCRHLFT